MKVKLVETIWFTQKPDCYGGSTCDQIEPRWHCFAECGQFSWKEWELNEYS